MQPATSPIDSVAAEVRGGVLGMLGGLATAGPIVMVVEDLHRGDPRARILDYKTGGLPNLVNLFPRKHHLYQMPLYALAAERLEPAQVDAEELERRWQAAKRDMEKSGSV